MATITEVWEEDGRTFAVDNEGDVFGVDPEGFLWDAEGNTLFENDGGDLQYFDLQVAQEEALAAEQEEQLDAGTAAAFEALEANLDALDHSLPRRLTSVEREGILQTAMQHGTVDAEDAYSRYLSLAKKPHPAEEGASESDDEMRALAQRYEDLKHPEVLAEAQQRTKDEAEAAASWKEDERPPDSGDDSPQPAAEEDAAD
jgi:hypothetical protein